MANTRTHTHTHMNLPDNMAAKVSYGGQHSLLGLTPVEVQNGELLVRTIILEVKTHGGSLYTDTHTHKFIYQFL